MNELLFSVPAILILSALYGAAMKLADLFNEHGLKWFRGDALLFGILWGIFGALLASGSPIIANLVLAMNISFILRGSLDFINHRIAASIIIISFIIFSPFISVIFIPALAVFIIFGVLEDNSHKFKKSRMLFYFADLMLYYPITALIISIIYSETAIFFSFVLFSFSYNFIKYCYKSKGYF